MLYRFVIVLESSVIALVSLGIPVDYLDSKLLPNFYEEINFFSLVCIFAQKEKSKFFFDDIYTLHYLCQLCVKSQGLKLSFIFPPLFLSYALLHQSQWQINLGQEAIRLSDGLCSVKNLLFPWCHYQSNFSIFKFVARHDFVHYLLDQRTCI